MENTSHNPERKQQPNHGRSNVQTTEFEKQVSHWEDVQTTQYEKQVSNWEDVQTTQYEKQVSNWEDVQTTPLGKGIATTRYEQQRPAWGPVQTATYGEPVVWTADPDVGPEHNMALRHQVFGEFETQFDLQN
jgi:hypothetical protein